MASPRILIVDDDKDVLDVLDECVSSLGYGTVRAMTGAAALHAVRADPPPDAVLLDITMPGTLNGVQTLQAIKALHADLPVIMVTANADLDIARETLREGAFDYVMKPAQLARLQDVLAAALAVSGKAPPPER